MAEKEASEEPRSTADVVRMIDDLQRLRGPLRIGVRHTGDGLGILIAPARRFGPVAFFAFWLCGWAVAEFMAVSQLIRGGDQASAILIWLIPWTFVGFALLWVVAWQLLGSERLFFTAGSLVREWSLAGYGGRRVLSGSQIRAVQVDNKSANDLAGLGTIKVETEGRSMRIGSGLPHYEAELVAALIRAAVGERRSSEGD